MAFANGASRGSVYPGECAGDAEVHFRISRQYPTRSHQPGPIGENAANQRARLVARVFLFYQSRGKFDGARGSGLKKAGCRGGGEKRMKTAIYTACARVGRNGEVETGTRQRDILYLSPVPSSFPLPLPPPPPSQKSIFVTAHWARLDSRG